MSLDANIAESSSAPEVAESQAQPIPIDSWSSDQRSKWLETGEVPTSKNAESATAKESSDDAEPVEAASEPARESETGNKQEPPAAKKRSGEDRKQELAREIQDLLRQRAELRAELEGKQPADKKAEAAAAKKPEAKAAEEGKPNPDDFKTYEEYIEALTDWRVEQRDKAKAAADAETQRKADEKAALDKWNSKVKEVTKVHKDYAEVVAAADIPVNAAIRDAIMSSDIGPSLLYHLCSNLDEAKRIAALPPIVAVRELGKLEAKLTPAAPEPKTTRASKPPTELAAKNTAPADEAEAAIKDGDFARYRRVMNSRQVA